MEISPIYNEYRIFRCSDCDPTLMDEDDEGERYEHAYEIILPIDGVLVKEDSQSSPIDNCPRCDSYLSLLPDSIVKVEKLRG